MANLLFKRRGSIPGHETKSNGAIAALDDLIAIDVIASDNKLSENAAMERRAVLDIYQIASAPYDLPESRQRPSADTWATLPNSHIVRSHTE